MQSSNPGLEHLPLPSQPMVKVDREPSDQTSESGSKKNHQGEADHKRHPELCIDADAADHPGMRFSAGVHVTFSGLW